MTALSDIVKFLEEVAPLHLQEDYDNSGLIVGDLSMEVRGVVVCLDSTEEVIDDCIAQGANVVIAHHPIVFSGLKSLTYRNYIEKTVIKAIKHDIAIYAIHTNLDNVLTNGVNQKIAEKLGLSDVSILEPQGEIPTIGSGAIGILAEGMSETAFFDLLKSQMNASVIRHTKLLGRSVHKIAVCGGSGSFLLERAIQKGADVFVTADFKYHQFFDADDKIVVADIGHFETEQFTIELLVNLLAENFHNFATHYTKINTNPVKYY